MDDAERLRELNLPDLSGDLQRAKGSLYQKSIHFGLPQQRALQAEPKMSPDATPRERMLAAGGELFARLGLAAVQLEHVAQAAGLTRASMMHLCLSREDLFHQVLKRQVDAFVAESQTWVDPQTNAMELIQTVAERSFAYIPTRPLLIQLVLGVLMEAMPGWEERLAHLRQRCTTGFAEALKAGIAQGLFRPEISVEVVGNLLMDLHAASYLSMDTGPSSAARILQRRNAALDLIFMGLVVR